MSTSDQNQRRIGPAQTTASAARAERRREPLEPAAQTGAPMMETLPSSYREDRLSALTVSPDRIVVYWDLRPQTASTAADRRWELRARINGAEMRFSIRGIAGKQRIQTNGASEWSEIRLGPVNGVDEIEAVARLSQAPKTTGAERFAETEAEAESADPPAEPAWTAVCDSRTNRAWSASTAAAAETAGRDPAPAWGRCVLEGRKTRLEPAEPPRCAGQIQTEALLASSMLRRADSSNYSSDVSSGHGFRFSSHALPQEAPRDLPHAPDDPNDPER